MPAQERWLPVPGWPEYSVSDRGRVVSHKYGEPRLVKGWVQDGYRSVGLRANGVRAIRKVHTLVAAAFIGPRPEGQETRHLDGDSLRNDLTNLCYGSHSDNMQDRLAHGRHPMANKTHCKRDHEFTPDNTLVYRGSRFCRACKRLRYEQAMFRAAGIEVAA